MRGAVNGEREQGRVNDGEPLDILFGVRSPALNARTHLRAFYAEDGRRELVHTEVPADLMVGIFWMRSMRAEASRALITRFILKKQRPAIAERANVLRWKIREAAKIAGGSGKGSAWGARPFGLRRILDEGDLSLAERSKKRRELLRLAKEMNGDERARAFIERLAREIEIEEKIVADIDKDRFGADACDGSGGRKEREGRRNHFIVLPGA